MMERILTLLAACCVLMLLLIVAGCTRTVYVDRPVEHLVEVPVSCLEQDDIPPEPPYAMEAMRPPVDDGAVVLALREEIAQREDYIAAIMALLRGCQRLN